jgi:hypothetical protein
MSDTGSEIRKLARLLRIEPDELAFAAEAPVDELRRFREQMTDVLLDADADRQRRAAEAAKLLPVGVVAKIARQSLGPMLCARLTGHMDVKLALGVAERLDTPFVAELAAELDPRRAASVVTALPAERIAEIAVAMAEADEHVAMGRFVGHLDDEALAACVDALEARDILLVAYVLEADDRLDAVAACLDDERIAQLTSLATDAGLADEMTDLIEHLGPEQRARVLAAAES